MVYFNRPLIKYCYIQDKLVKFVMLFHILYDYLYKWDSFAFAAKIRPHPKPDFNGLIFLNYAKKPTNAPFSNTS